MTSAVSMHQCWANVSRPEDDSLIRCHARVPADPDHIGLCGRHVDELSADEILRDMRDDAIDSILYPEDHE